MARKNDPDPSLSALDVPPAAPATPAAPAAQASPTPEVSSELERLRAENARLAAALEAKPDVAKAEPTARPQGVVQRFMDSGDERKDFHPRWRQVRMIDPKSLIVDGRAPALALPIPETGGVRIRRIDPEHAAYLLSCDPASGGASVYRLATDAEVADYEDELERRRAPAEASRAKDVARSSK